MMLIKTKTLSKVPDMSFLKPTDSSFYPFRYVSEKSCIYSYRCRQSNFFFVSIYYLTLKNSLKRIFKSFDLMLIYFLTLLFSDNAEIYLVVMPLFIQEKLHYSVLVLILYNISFYTCSLVFLFIMLAVKVSSTAGYHIGMRTLSLLFLIGLYLKILVANHGKLYNNATLTATSIFVAISCNSKYIFRTVSIANLVKTYIRSLADGIRALIQLGGVEFGSLSSSLYIKIQIYSMLFLV